MARTVTDFIICYFEEYWTEDYAYSGYVEGASPIRSYTAPSWYSSDLVGLAFYGQVFHTFEMKVTATEKYRLGGAGSEHILPDDAVVTVTEVWTAKYFDGSVVRGPTTVTHTDTVANIELVFPFLRKSKSLGGSGLETPWFSFSCGEAGAHACSAITWYGQELAWPTLSFSESYTATVNAGVYNGEPVMGSVSLVSGGSISCQCDGGYERNGYLRLASYHVNVSVVGEGPNSYTVKLEPKDYDGNSLVGPESDRHSGYVLFGDLYTVDENDSHRIASINNSTYTGDASKYCKKVTLPLDTTYNFPVARVRDNCTVVITTEGIGGITTPPIPGWESYPPDAFPVRYEVNHEQRVRSELTKVTAVLDRENFFGLAPAARDLANFDDAHPGIYALHRFHEEAAVTCKEVATVQQFDSKLLGLGYIGGWSPSPGCSFSLIGTEMEFTTPSSAFSPSFFLSNPQTWNFRPYRYFTFDYDVVSGGTVSLTITLNDTSSGTVRKKFYVVSLSGTGTYNVDLCWPSAIVTEVSGEGVMLMASRLTTENQAEKTGVTDSAYAGTGTGLKERFSGFRGCSDATFAFSGPSVVRISNLKKTCIIGDIQFNHWTQQKSELNDAGTFGNLDYKDAWRIPQSGQQVKQYIDLLDTRQSMNVAHGSYSLASVWLSPTTVDTLGGLVTPAATLYGWWSQHNADMTWLGRRNPVPAALPVYVTLGSYYFNGHTGMSEIAALDYDPSDNPVLVQCESVVGSVFSGTGFKAAKDTVIHVYGTSGLGTIDQVYSTLLGGYGRLALDRYRPKDVAADPTQTQNLEHYVSMWPSEKQYVYNTGLHNIFWIGVQGTPKGKKPSLDYFRSGRHLRSYFNSVDQFPYIGVARNQLPLSWFDSAPSTDIEKASVKWNVNSRWNKARVLHINTDETLNVSDSSDEGRTLVFIMNIESGTKCADFSITEHGKMFVYYILDGGTTVKCKVYDKNDTLVESFDTNIVDADPDMGISVDESTGSRGGWRMGILYTTVAGVLTTKLSDKKGSTFS